MTSRDRVIAAPRHDYLLPETPAENILTLFETIRTCGQYGGTR